MKTNLTKIIAGTFISGALLVVGAGLNYLFTNYEFVNKEDTKKEETHVNYVEEEEPQTKTVEFNTNNATYTDREIKPAATTPLTIEDIKVFDTNLYDGTSEVTFKVTNNTDKYINRIYFHIYYVDANDNKLTDTFVQIDVQLAPNAYNDILTKGIINPQSDNYSYILVEATDFRY